MHCVRCVRSAILDTPDNGFMSTSLLLTAYLGILEPTTVEPPEGSPEGRRELGNFELAVFGQRGVLDCACGRHEPIPVALEDLEKASPVQGLLACPLCVHESRSARSRTQMVEAWIRRRRKAINKIQHLYLPESLERFAEKGQLLRPRRYVYQVFFNVKLKSDDHVLSTCDDQFCLNPYHMMLGKSPARKVSPQMKLDIQQWSNNNASTQTILGLLKIKYGKSFSARTVQLIKKELRQSGFTKI